MRSSKLAALAALSLFIGTSAASAQVAAASPALVERAGAPARDASDLRGTTGWIIGAIVLGLLIWGGIELFGDDEEDAPVSP